MGQHLFVSYSHKDEDYVRRLEAYLADAGFDIWTDRGIEPGHQWARAIDEQVRACAALIPVMSGHSRDSYWVTNEILLAQRLRKPILPLLLGGEPFTELLGTQYEDVTGETLPTERFIRRLRDLAGYPGGFPAGDRAGDYRPSSDLRAPTLGQLVGPLARSSDRGLSTSDRAAVPVLHAAVGILDKRIEQEPEPFLLDLSGGGGNLALIGGPRSGKSNFLRTLVGSLALRHTPREVQFYLLDFGGGTLSALAGLPHVGGAATRRDVDRVRRTLAEVQRAMELREVQFTANAIDDIDEYRRAKAAGQFAHDPFGDVFLVIDGWPTLKNEFDDLEEAVGEIARRGLGFGFHLLISSNRWAELGAAVRDMLGTKVELRLGDPADSMVNPRAAASVPEHTPGRGLAPEGVHFATALPRLDASTSVEDLSQAVFRFVQLARESWSHPAAPAVRLLPHMLSLDALPAPAKGRLPIGIAESDLQPISLDFDAEPHALLFGDVESGKSSFLRSLAKMIVASYDPSQARVIFVDHRRSLLGSIGEPHLIGYGTSRQSTEGVVHQVIAALRQRLPSDGITSEQLRNRDWWTGPEAYLLVDDYDLVAGPSNPLAPLIEYLPQARDLGLHVVVTRRIGGASRALYDPFIAGIRELASPGIMLSGPREEGYLFGTVKPSPLPAGRGWMFTRRHKPRLIQLAWTPPSE